MSKPVLLSIGNGKVQELVGTANNDVLTWDSTLDGGSWKSAAGGGGGSGTVTSVGLTGGTSGIVIGGTASPITTSGTFNLDAPQRFAFDTTTPIAPVAAGQMSWNATEGSLSTMMVGGNVDAVIGQQLYQRAVNNDTVTLTKGMVVYVDGSSGTRVTVKRATASADLTSATIIGVVAESIAVNASGFVITEGTLKDLSVLPTTSFADGDVVYLSPSTAGGLTTTKPVAPDHLVMVGYCVKASNGAAGILLVKTQNGYELDELHNVKITSATSGNTLIYNGDAGKEYWQNAFITGTTNQVTVTNGAGSITLSTPQDIGTSSSPTFAGLSIDTLNSKSSSAVTVTGSAPTYSFSLQGQSGAIGTAIVLQGGDTSDANASHSGAPVNIVAGNGTGTGNPGGYILLWGGNATAGNANGGSVSIRAGTKAGTGTNGTVSLGTANTSAITIGATGITTTVNGTLTLANALAISSGGTGATSTSQNYVFAGPTSGSGAPSFRTLTADDIRNLAPYDVLGRFAGNPATNAVLYSSPVPRSVTVSTTTGNHYFYASALPSAGTSVITVYKTLASNGTKSALFTATWTAGQAAAANGLYQAVIGTVSNNTFVAGDVLSVEMGTTNTSFVNPQFAVSATA